MNLLYPSPQPYGDIPTVETLVFFCLMSPDYGETATMLLEDNRLLVVSKIGRLMGVVGSGDKMGKYIVYIVVKDQMPDNDYLTAEQANQRIRELMSE